MWNNNGLNEDDREALSTISTKPPLPTLKLHSLNPQHLNKLHLQHHNHSFDEQTISSLNYEHPTFNNHARYDHSISLPLSNLSLSVDSSPVLPEFTASGGTGIFKAPTRSAVHPSRPSALELRPHPLRETQVGRFLRTIGCTETQIWAGQESGVRFWMIKDAYQHGCGLGGRIRRGDEDAAPFYESGNKTSPTLCMEVDHGNKLVWTGHKDGRIRSWKMDVDVSGDDSTKFEEGLSWSAHKGPVLAMLISSYGDIWSGSEGGVIKIWPWETVEKSLSMSPEEKHISSFLVERTFIDLRSQVTVNGVCNISSSDIKAILSDHTRGRVWCATSLSFSLWDARTKELIKVFNIDGQIENRVEMPVPQDQAVPPQEDEMKVKFVYQPSKKEKSHNFLKRSKNAIMGAAGAVRRVASRGASTFNEESKKTEAMVLTTDGTIWSGCSNGLLIQWDWNGNRIQDLTHHPRPVLCFCTYGSKLWVGYASGVIQLLDLDGNIIAGWVAHSSPVIKMAIGGGYVFSMAIHGGIRGWHITSQGPIDNMLRTELAAKEELYTRHESFKILVGTWNVGQGKPPHEGLKSWLGSAASDVGIVVIGLQEVGMGAGFLAMAAAKETVGLEGSAIGQLWQDAIGRVLGEGLVFERVGSRQLAGLLIAIWVKKNLRPYVGDLDVAAVACGFGRTIGNKGGVGLRLRVHDRIICFVNCHLAAHLEAVNRRNSDFDHIFRTMVFSRQTNLMNVAAAGATCASLLLRTVNGSSSGNSDEGRPDLSQADMVIFCGDFNYRLFGITYDEARDVVSQRSFDWLREKDQLRAEMKDGKVFQGMHEAEIRFPPTYKFEKYKPGLGGYDSGEKKRIPAWCDRVIYRDCRNGPVTECNLSCPIISSVHMYEACMDVNDSDHKPVRCKLNVRLARVDRSIRRKEFGKIMNNNDQLRTLLRDLSNVPETSISTDKIVLQNQETCTLCISNKSQIDKAIIRVVCEGQRSVHGNQDSTGFRPRGSFGFPPWLQITPASGIIKPEESVEILVHHADFQTSGDSAEGVPQNWWSEDTRDKEVILSVQVRGCYSIEAKTHIIHIRHCYSALSVRIESRTSSSRRGSNGSHHWNDKNFDVCDRG